MNRVIRFALAALAAVSVMGLECDPKEEAFWEFITGGAPLTGNLTGTVTGGGSPLAGANVMLGPVNLTTMTGAGGSYTFSDVPFGTYSVGASAMGFTCPSPISVTVGSQSVTAPPIDCQPAAGTLVVHVVETPGNTPIAGAAVAASGPGVTLSGTSGSDGTGTFQNVAPVQVSVTATSDGRACSPATGQVQAGQTTDVTVPCTPIAGSYTNQGMVTENSCSSTPAVGSSFSNSGIMVAHLSGNQYSLQSDELMTGMLVGTQFNLQGRGNLSGNFDVVERLQSNLVRDPVTGAIVITGTTTIEVVDNKGTSGTTDDTVECRITLNPIRFDGPLVASSLRFKRGIRPLLPSGMSLLGLRPVAFRYLAPWGDPDAPQIGLIAEEVAALFPAAVSRDAKGRPAGISYPALAGLVIEEMEVRVGRTLAAGIVRLADTF